MFKNTIIYRIANGWTLPLDEMEVAACEHLFTPCGPTQESSIGWVPPRGTENDAIVESINGHRIMKLMIEKKSVPSAQVKKHAQEAADHIEATTGRKPGRKETKALREDALLALLPQAFPVQTAVWVWFDLGAGLLVIDTASQSRADEVVSVLIRTFDKLAVSLLNTTLTPTTAMAKWLMAESPDEWPEDFAVERECELKSHDEEKALVRFKNHHLQTDEVRKHITEGKLPARLAMSWDGRISFVLTESMQLRKLAFLEGVFDDQPGDKEQDKFDADVAIATGEMSRMIPAIVEAMGGELSPTA